MKLISLAEGDHHELILTDDGQVLGWEEENVLVGSNYKYYSLKQLSFIKGIVGKVTHIGAGYVHSIVLTEGNRIFGWGNNAYGQIGVSHFRFCTKPTETEGIEGKIVKISISHFHNLVLTQDGKIWGWGRNEEMQIEKNPIKIKKPKIIGNFNEKIIDIAAGSRFSLALTESGKVWGWGENMGGLPDSIGKGEYVPPFLIDGGIGKIKSIAAGGMFSLALTTEGKVIFWGSFKYLGQEKNLEVYKPHVVEITDKVTDISCSTWFCYAKTEKNQVFGWGRNNSNFMNIASKIVETPVLLGKIGNEEEKIIFGPGGKIENFKNLERIVRYNVGQSISL